MTETTEQFNRRVAAARFMLEAPIGSQFQYSSKQGKLYQPCGPDEAFTMMLEGTPVRVRPTSKKVLRPIEDIFKYAIEHTEIALGDFHGEIFIGGIKLYDLLGLCINHNSISVIDFPDWFFTEVEG